MQMVALKVCKRIDINKKRIVAIMRKGFIRLKLLLLNKGEAKKRNQSSLFPLCPPKLSPFPCHFSTQETCSPETYNRQKSVMFNYSAYVRGIYNEMDIHSRTDFNGHNKYKNTCCFFSYPEPETSVRQIEERNCTRRMNK